MKRSPIKRHPHRDPVSHELRLAVLERDHGVCVAPWIELFSGSGDLRPLGICAGRLTLDHVQDGYGRMGLRAPSDLAHLVTLCEWHHLESGWATSHRSELRAYLESVS